MSADLSGDYTFVLSDILKENNVSDWRQRAIEAEAEKERKKSEKEWRESEIERVNRLPSNAPEQRARKAKHLEESQLKAAAERQNRLKQHGNRFRCAICGKRSEVPGTISKTVRKYNAYADLDDPAIETTDDWSKPGDLFRCTNMLCGRLVCSEHYAGGYCMNCAKKKFGE